MNKDHTKDLLSVGGTERRVSTYSTARAYGVFHTNDCLDEQKANYYSSLQ